ncbi:DUF2075 domain-containing protein [Mycetocola spongiae]|uniref:DUF2075 domain-containing protein n=1 Tax=Mycetocola spongiae TaxID=2859226 RepID=UPI001CF50F89|nr:DUF2075 domain-containing protein [Mycetocola spongiae]UCR89906.1 DUF2075 domain-containing protein [Mycetocola spongiae]
MTGSSIRRHGFSPREIGTWAALDPYLNNWPVVYLLENKREVYVGETRNATVRMQQHLSSPEKQRLTEVRVIVNEQFNKSVCLDLESYLIQMLDGDGRYKVLNRNAGMLDSDYFDRERYRTDFDEIFDELRSAGIFTRTIPEIINSDLFKLSPFKALNSDQAAAVENILEGLFADLDAGRGGTLIVQGEPGTGKTVIAIHLMKLLRDIELTDPVDAVQDSESLFTEFFTAGYREKLRGLRIGLVIPQQSLRKSVAAIFKKTPGLSATMVLTPFQAGASKEKFDLLIVDEAHRLNHRANQSAGGLNKQFSEITTRLFGHDDREITQLDWIRKQSTHQLLLIDEAQSVRPADLPRRILTDLIGVARSEHRHFRLRSQMRVRGGNEYIEYVRAFLSATPPEHQSSETYEFRMFNSAREMHEAILAQDARHGLSRLIAGFAWPWITKKNPDAYDIEIEGYRLRWNQTDTDWINSPGSEYEVGSIHTVQGYDLNYAGVIIGGELRMDPKTGEFLFNRENYFDAKGKENNRARGIIYTDKDILEYVLNIYGVLLTRGIRGTYVYVVDPVLREYLRAFTW